MFVTKFFSSIFLGVQFVFVSTVLSMDANHIDASTCMVVDDFETIGNALINKEDKSNIKSLFREVSRKSVDHLATLLTMIDRRGDSLLSHAIYANRKDVVKMIINAARKANVLDKVILIAGFDFLNSEKCLEFDQNELQRSMDIAQIFIAAARESNTLSTLLFDGRKHFDLARESYIKLSPHSWSSRDMTTESDLRLRFTTAEEEGILAQVLAKSSGILDAVDKDINALRIIIHFAKRSGKETLGKVLTTKNDSNATILYMAAMGRGGQYSGSLDLIVNAAEEAGQDILKQLLRTTDASGCTALHYCAQEPDQKTLHQLLYAADKAGILKEFVLMGRGGCLGTALHCAARCGRTENVSRLCHGLHDSDLHELLMSLDSAGRTALDKAKQHQHVDVEKKLIELGKQVGLYND